MGFFSSKPRRNSYSDLLESLAIGANVGDVYNFGAWEQFAASNYIEHDSSRRWATKNFNSNNVPIFIEFDRTSKYKNSVRARYRDRHLGWIPKNEAKALVNILKKLPEGASLAANGHITDLGRGGSKDYGRVIMELTVYSKLVEI